MDRTLKVYTKTDHLFAELIFHYDHPGQSTLHYTQYRRLYNDDEEDESKSVYPLTEMDTHLQFRQFDTIDQVKAYDIEIVKEHLGRDMTDPPVTYRYFYDPNPVLLRYVAANHIGCIGIIDFRFSFIENAKEMKFLSATNPRFDFELTSNSLETNINCIDKITLYSHGGDYKINTRDLKRLEPWY